VAAFKDITGQRFERLTAIKRLGRIGGGSRWLCKCDCGNHKEVFLTHLTRGLIRSCGCLWQEARTKHGMANTALYSRWRGMKSRCDYTSHKQYRDYGGRGIAYAAEWERFEPFAEWALANGYAEGLELDRINPDGNYEPSNCRWITHRDNMQNMRRSTRITVRGIEYSLSDAALVFGVNKYTIRSRLGRGDSHEKAVRPVAASV
jgi:hypothetical protein